MEKNTIYLENKNYPELHKLACVASTNLLVKTDLGNIVLKEHNQFHDVQLPNSDPYYANMKNLYCTRYVKNCKCEFIITIHDNDILQTLLTKQQLKNSTNQNMKSVFTQLNTITDFIRYLSFKKIMRQDKHVILTVSDKDIKHHYRFDSANAVYYQDKLVGPDTPQYRFLNSLFFLYINKIGGPPFSRPSNFIYI